MDNYFSKYVSNTSAATGNQSYFSCSESSVGRAKFGGHPNEDGCKVWAENLYKMLKGNENVF